MRKGERTTRAPLGPLGSEGGFSLAELLVVIVVLAIMMATVFGILEVSQRAYSRAASMEDVQTGARAVTDQLAMELRLIGSSYFGATGFTNPPITEATSTRITFWGDIDVDTLSSNADATTTGAAAGAMTVPVSSSTGFCQDEALYIVEGSVHEVKTISDASGTSVTIGSGLVETYTSAALVRSVEMVTWEYDGANSKLTRTITRDSVCAAPAAQDMLTNVVSMSFKYYDASGTELTTTPINRNAIRAIEVNLIAQATDGNRRAMQFTVQPRSLQLL